MNEDIAKRIQALQPLLKDPAFDVRSAAARAIEQLEGMRSTDDLLEALKTGDLGAKIAAIHGLGLIGGDKVLAPLVYCVSRPEDDIRSAAVQALGRIAHPATLKTVLECLEDSNSAVQARAIAALASFDPSPALAQRVRQYLDANDGMLEAEAAMTLARFRDLFSLDRIMALLTSPHETTRLAAATALSLMPLQ